jgi:mannose-6-phosphate isomerase-like protein (cupin superfamily)
MSGIIRARRNLLCPIGLVVISATSAACTATMLLPDPLEAGWNGSPVCERLHKDSSQRVLRCTFPPDVGHERHYHAPHFGYTIAGGRMRITDENGIREVDLQTGSSFVSDGVVWHEVINIGGTTTVFLIVERK